MLLELLASRAVQVVGPPWCMPSSLTPLPLQTGLSSLSSPPAQKPSPGARAPGASPAPQGHGHGAPGPATCPRGRAWGATAGREAGSGQGSQHKWPQKAAVCVRQAAPSPPHTEGLLPPGHPSCSSARSWEPRAGRSSRCHSVTHRQYPGSAACSEGGSYFIFE